MAAMSAPPKCHRRIDVIFTSHGSLIAKLASCCRAGQGAKHRRAIAVGATRPLRAHRAGVRHGASIFWSNSAHKRVAGWTSCGGDGMNAPPNPVLGHERMKTFRSEERRVGKEGKVGGARL